MSLSCGFGIRTLRASRTIKAWRPPLMGPSKPSSRKRLINSRRGVERGSATPPEQGVR